MPSLVVRSGGYISAARILKILSALAILWLVFFPSSPAQAALCAFMITSAFWLKSISRRQLDGLSIERLHLPRVFQSDPVEVRLRIHRGKGLPIQLLEVEDLFMASMDVTQRRLVPLLTEGWVVQIKYDQRAERHRGLYLLGPVRIYAADPLGVFPERREIDCMTRLTVYPQADPLPHYELPGPVPPMGISMDQVRQVGQGEEILGVREYTRGDPPSRIHWRTSARRGKLHVIQRSRAIQAELLLLLDLTRFSRFGLGAESSAEMAILTAVSILRRAHETRHRVSMSYAHGEAVHFPAGSGLAHMQLLLDRLAVLNPEGETDFWSMAGRRALQLSAGSRAVFITVAKLTPLERAVPLVRHLVGLGVAVDCVLIDERDFIKIYREQEFDLRKGEPDFAMRSSALRLAGARIWPLHRGQHGAMLPLTA